MLNKILNPFQKREMKTLREKYNKIIDEQFDLRLSIQSHLERVAEMEQKYRRQSFEAKVIDEQINLMQKPILILKPKQ